MEVTHFSKLASRLNLIWTKIVIVIWTKNIRLLFNFFYLKANRSQSHTQKINIPTKAVVLIHTKETGDLKNRYLCT